MKIRIIYQWQWQDRQSTSRPYWVQVKKWWGWSTFSKHRSENDAISTMDSVVDSYRGRRRFKLITELEISPFDQIESPR